MRTRWETRSGPYDHELEFTGTRVVYKQWFDHGKDPNRSEVTVPEFLDGALHDDIRHYYGQQVLAEVIEVVDSLTTGGPGVAIPPE